MEALVAKLRFHHLVIGNSLYLRQLLTEEIVTNQLALFFIDYKAYIENAVIKCIK